MVNACYDAGMFGPKLTKVFRSRWNALFWSASVLLTAYCSVPAKQEPGRADTQAISSIATIGQHKKAPSQHKNPWAKDAKP